MVRLKLLSVSIVIIVQLLLAPMSLAKQDDDDDRNKARELSQQGIILPLSTLVKKAQQIHQGKLLEVEFKRKSKQYLYEIELLDKNGVVWEMYFDAVSGDLVKEEKED